MSLLMLGRLCYRWACLSNSESEEELKPMSKKMSLIVLTVFLILLGAGLAMANVELMEFSGVAWMAAPPTGGDVKCIGGTPTGTWPPCTPENSKAQIRGMILTYRQVCRNADGTVNPLVTGTRTIVFNFTGGGVDRRNHAWGTWRLVLDGGIGESEGTFTGFGGNVPNQGQIVGHGTEGEVEGIQLRATYTYDQFPGLETLTGYLLDPRGSR
jgi:hypothetical protein